jgi:hypothetical protein
MGTRGTDPYHHPSADEAMTGFTDILRSARRFRADLEAEKPQASNEIVDDNGNVHVSEALSPTQSEVR